MSSVDLSSGYQNSSQRVLSPEEKLFQTQQVNFIPSSSSKQQLSQSSKVDTQGGSVATIDGKLKRKVEARVKYFTSQITEVQGPPKTLVRNVGTEYKVEKDQEFKLAQEKN